MARYRNNTHRTIRFSLGKNKDFAIPAGARCELPEDNDYIRSLEAQGTITRCEEPKSEPASTQTGADKEPSGDKKKPRRNRTTKQNLNEK